MTRDEMTRWLREYDRVRTEPDSNPPWTSTKFDIEGLHWKEIADIYIPELEMCWGPACSALKKSWFNYTFTKKRGEPAGDIAYRINKIQNSLGIPMTEFREYPWFPDLMEMEENFTEEERQLRQEEYEDGKEEDDIWDEDDD